MSIGIFNKDVLLPRQLRHGVLIALIVGLFSFVFIASHSSFAYSAVPPLKIGVASMITPVDAVKYYQAIIDYIGGEVGQENPSVRRLWIKY